MVGPPVQHAIEHGMDHEAARIRLVGGRHDLPAFAPAVGDIRQIGRFSEGMIEALDARQRLRRSFKSLLGQQRRPQSVPRRVADADAFRRRAQTLA